jgi:hypothetical protein
MRAGAARRQLWTGDRSGRTSERRDCDWQWTQGVAGAEDGPRRSTIECPGARATGHVSEHGPHPDNAFGQPDTIMWAKLRALSERAATASRALGFAAARHSRSRCRGGRWRNVHIDGMVGRAPYASLTIGGAMNTLAFRIRLGVLGLSVRRFAAITGVHYETARHWGGLRRGQPRGFPRWVPLMLEMMEPTMSRRPPDETLRRPRRRSDGA